MIAELKHIDNGFFQVSDKLAAQLAKMNRTLPSLPPHGYERRVKYANQLWWLTRTPYRVMLDAPKRGWVWAIYAPRPLTNDPH
jgi:hypothetical protein